MLQADNSSLASSPPLDINSSISYGYHNKEVVSSNTAIIPQSDVTPKQLSNWEKMLDPELVPLLSPQGANDKDIISPTTVTGVVPSTEVDTTATLQPYIYSQLQLDPPSDYSNSNTIECSFVDNSYSSAILITDSPISSPSASPKGKSWLDYTRDYDGEITLFETLDSNDSNSFIDNYLPLKGQSENEHEYICTTPNKMLSRISSLSEMGRLLEKDGYIFSESKHLQTFTKSELSEGFQSLKTKQEQALKLDLNEPTVNGFKSFVAENTMSIVSAHTRNNVTTEISSGSGSPLSPVLTTEKIYKTKKDQFLFLKAPRKSIVKKHVHKILNFEKDFTRRNPAREARWEESYNIYGLERKASKVKLEDNDIPDKGTLNSTSKAATNPKGNIGVCIKRGRGRPKKISNIQVISSNNGPIEFTHNITNANLEAINKEKIIPFILSKEKKKFIVVLKITNAKSSFKEALSGDSNSSCNGKKDGPKIKPLRSKNIEIKKESKNLRKQSHKNIKISRNNPGGKRFPARNETQINNTRDSVNNGTGAETSSAEETHSFTSDDNYSSSDTKDYNGVGNVSYLSKKALLVNAVSPSKPTGITKNGKHILSKSGQEIIIHGKKKKWHNSQDRKIILLKETLNLSWRTIQKRLETKHTWQAIQMRYLRSLKGRWDLWTEEEELKLFQLFQKDWAKRWSRISSEMGPSFPEERCLRKIYELAGLEICQEQLYFHTRAAKEVNTSEIDPNGYEAFVRLYLTSI